MTLVLGTRGSPLARAQTDITREALFRARPDAKVEVKIVKTEGDKNRAVSIAQLGTGAFTKELEDALEKEEVDLAVHSLKDLPTEIKRGLVLAATLPRADWRDVLCSRDRKKLGELPHGARLGTSSPRRTAQVLALRPDLRLEEIRGNVETRLKRLELPPDDPKALDGVLLARAGLDRLGKAGAIAETLDRLLPAPGQGAIGLEARSGDAATLALARAIDHDATSRSTRAERLLHKLLGGGCRAPVGALARVVDGALHLEAVVASLDGKTLLRAEGDGNDPETIARAVFERLEKQGAVQLLASVRTPPGTAEPP
jgi:hydroxymethylbilane synthase